MSASSDNNNHVTSNQNRAAKLWKLKSRSIEFSTVPCIMGIVNVTPDSFSDGGRHNDLEQALAHALELESHGAGILDIGGESTRPYSEPVTESEELRRVIPLIEKLSHKSTLPISIDTSKSKVAFEAIQAGAEIINDVTGLEGDPKMLKVAIDSGAGVCAMHMQGTPQTMQNDPQYQNVTSDIFQYLAGRKEFLVAAGCELEKVCLDPGIGFGKTHDHNIQLVKDAHRFLELGCPILVGHSRKGFLGKILDDKSLDRDAATLAVSLLLARRGIQIIRVHEVERTFQALKTLGAFLPIQ